MSYRVGTPNYNLPQTEGTDKRDWSDTNGAFLAIDTAIKNAVDTSATASSAAATAQQTADGATTAAAHAQTDATTAQALATSASELATLAKSTADTAKSTADSAVSNLPRHTVLGEVIADGVKTRLQIFTELTALVDFTKLRLGVSVLDVDGDYAYTYDQFITSNNTAYFGLANNVIRQITLQKNGSPTDSYFILGTSTEPQNAGNSVPAAGQSFKVFA